MVAVYKAWYGAVDDTGPRLQEIHLYDSSGNLLWFGIGPSIFTEDINAGEWTDTFSRSSGSDTTSTLDVTVDRSDGYVYFTFDGRTYSYSLSGYVLTQAMTATVPTSDGKVYVFLPSGSQTSDFSGAILVTDITVTVNKPEITSVTYGTGSADVTWGHIPHGSATYELQWASDSNFTQNTGSVQTGDNIRYATATNLAPDIGGYYWKVIATEGEQFAVSDPYYLAYTTGGGGVSYNEIPVKSYLKIVTPVANDHAASKGYVDSVIAGESGGFVPTKDETGYVFQSNATSGSAGTWTAISTTVANNDSGLVTSQAVYTAINALATVYAAATHTHGTSAITSGEFLPDRLPTATSQAKGAVIIGNGIQISSGVISIKLATNSGLSVTSSGLSIDTAYITGAIGLGTAAFEDTGTSEGDIPVLGANGKLAASALPQANGVSAAGIVTQGNGVTITAGSLTVTAGNGIDVGSSGVAVKLDTTGGIPSGLSVSSSGLKVNTTDLSTLLSLGTAASVDTGTSSGEVPVLDSNGKLPTSVLPALAITNTFIATTQAMMLMSGAQEGDICIRTDLHKTFILLNNTPSDIGNWQELMQPEGYVASVNGNYGTVTISLSDLGGIPSSKLETSLTTSSDDKIPTSKAVATYVSGYALPLSYLETSLTASSDVKVPSSKAIATYVSTTYATKDASSLTSGTISADRLPTATNQAKGAIIVGGGLVVTTGVLSVDFLSASQGVYDTTNDTKAITAKAAKAIADAAASSAATGYVGTVTGNGSATSLTATHNLGTTNVLVQVYDPSGVPCLVAYTRDTNSITLQFANAPANGVVFTVMVISLG